MKMGKVNECGLIHCMQNFADVFLEKGFSPF